MNPSGLAQAWAANFARTIAVFVAILLVLNFIACDTGLRAPSGDSGTVSATSTDPPATNQAPQNPGPADDDDPIDEPNEPASDPTDCFKLPQSEQAACLALSDEELVLYLSQDADGDGSSNLMEATNGTDPFDPLLGGDIDGDGIENRRDSDVDGDGEDNGEDADIDGDGVDNGDDEDVDGDGLLEFEDDDDDGDGVDDEDDEDDDGDGDDDCGCEHGRCSSFGGQCFCDEGWKGEDCDEFHCNDVRCHNGTCVGPNTCRCNAGWQSVGSIPCVEFHCRGVRNCSGHGQCTGPDICTCEDDWKGSPDCSRHTCVARPSYCNQGPPCTTAVCGTTTGCHYVPSCSSTEVCLAGDCFPACNDRSTCADGQSCRDGGCQDGCFGDDDCDDGDPCTIDTCNASDSCENAPKPCPTLQSCVRGRCVVGCLGTCPDEQVCRDRGCFDGCEDDESRCGQDEKCENGACVPAECETDDDCEDGQTCADGLCTSE